MNESLKNPSWFSLQLLSEWVGTERLAQFSPIVAIFGSARLPAENIYYQHTFALAKRLAERGFTILTGGGPGIMCAANAGAKAAQNGTSIGLNIQLPHEQHPNPHQDLAFHFQHFPTRKLAFSQYSSAYVVMPGGMGTLDELFEVLTLIQTKKIPKAPVILFGSAFWSGLMTWLRDFLATQGLIAWEDVEALQVVDEIEKVEELLAPLLENQ